MSALKEIKERLSGQKPDTVTELDLSGIKIGRFSDEIKKFLEKLKKLSILILSECELDTLDNMPNWKLTAIDLSSNNLDDSSIARLVSYPTLTQILFVNNKIESIDGLKQLSGLPLLSEVDFSLNPVATKEGYPATLFSSISTLEIVDQKDKDGKEMEEEELASGEDDEEDYEDEDDEEFDGEEEEEEYEEESSEKPKKKRK